MTSVVQSSFRRVLDELALKSVLETDGASVSGLMGPARSLAQAELTLEAESPSLIVVADERRLANAVSDLTSFLNALGGTRPVLPFPAFALDPYRGLSPHLDVVSARIRALMALQGQEQAVVVATAAALLYRTVNPKLLATSVLDIRAGESFDPWEIEKHLVESGYRYEDPVTTPGDFARRGGILDVFPPHALEVEGPVRLEFLGEELEEIRRFDPQTQRTTGNETELRLMPASEWTVLPEHLEALEIEDVSDSAGLGFMLPRHRDFQANVFDFEPSVVLVEEPDDVLRAAELEWERVLTSYDDAEEDVSRYAAPAELLMGLEALTEKLAEKAVGFREMGLLGQETRHISTSILPSYRGRVSDFLAELKGRVNRNHRVHVFLSGEGMIDRAVELLSDAGITAGRPKPDAEGQVVLEHGALSQGFIVPELSLAVFTASEVFSEPPRTSPRKGVKLRRFLSDFRDLKVGDYVVHTEHGIGVFSGLKQVDDGGTEFVVLEYQGGDKLYVPVDRLDYLEKYSSAEAAKPRIEKLGGTGWARVKKRVRKSMRDMAQELLKLYAQRKAAPGYAFQSDSAWMQEFEALFEFEETPDQLQAIHDVKHDMEAASPMDRLICGDVGYGKTEVAMRAAFKAVSDHKQVAVLVPTTVLAFQHLTTFTQRFAPFPVRVEMLSRFRSRKEQKKIVEDLAAGKVDIVIGTHRLLSKDVSFSDLGLLVVDEEQRFGVSHKEKLKRLRHGVDSLTLTATPIPRTLHMSLSGIRDLSVIETPPKDRMSIQTHITHLDPKVLAEAIRFELGRSGQVYFVHNRVSSIYSMASFLTRLVPEARVIVGHGQMKESELESVMLSFIRGEFDILLSTTIIENGLDIPLVNTLMVNRADRFGLSQLYQLRGRVGRSNRRAYAYLLVPEEAKLTPIARRRLAAIREFSELGAGFRIAALDLELRGAGNLLGGEQHGHIDAVGFDLYCRLLDETIRGLSSDEPEAPSEKANLNLRLELRVPESFISDINQRMSIYKRASSARDEETIDKLRAETRDRFGPLPEKVLQFFEYARLSVLADGLRLAGIERERGRLAFRLTARTPIAAEALAPAAGAVSGVLRPDADGAVLETELLGAGPAEVLTAVREVLLQLVRYSKMSSS